MNKNAEADEGYMHMDPAEEKKAEREKNLAKLVEALNKEASQGSIRRFYRYLWSLVLVTTPAAIVLMNSLTDFTWINENIAHALERIAVALVLFICCASMIGALVLIGRIPNVVIRDDISLSTLEFQTKKNLLLRVVRIVQFLALLAYVASGAIVCAILTALCMVAMFVYKGVLQEAASNEIKTRQERRCDARI